MSQLFDPAFFAALTVVGAVIVWLIRLERRFGHMLTRKEHEVICQRNQGGIAAKLNIITEALQRQDSSTDRYRDKVLGELRELAIDVAVVQSQMGLSRRRRITATTTDPDGSE
jgi:hypothetical protein